MLFNRFIRILKSNLLSKESPDTHAENKKFSDSQSQSYTNNKQQNTGQSSTYSTSNSAEKSYYDALEVSEKASFPEIKAAYKRLVKKYHPDLFHNNAEKRRYAEIVTQKINEAYNYFEQKYGK